jgi:hypothetical protein
MNLVGFLVHFYIDCGLIGVIQIMVRVWLRQLNYLSCCLSIFTLTWDQLWGWDELRRRVIHVIAQKRLRGDSRRSLKNVTRRCLRIYPEWFRVILLVLVFAVGFLLSYRGFLLVYELRVDSGGVVFFEALIRVPFILTGPSSCGLQVFRFH